MQIQSREPEKDAVTGLYKEVAKDDFNPYINNGGTVVGTIYLKFNAF